MLELFKWLLLFFHLYYLFLLKLHFLIKFLNLDVTKYDLLFHVIHHTLFLQLQGKLLQVYQVQKKLPLHYFSSKYLKVLV